MMSTPAAPPANPGGTSPAVIPEAAQDDWGHEVQEAQCIPDLPWEMFADDASELLSKLKNLALGESYTAGLKNVASLEHCQEWGTELFYHGTSMSSLSSILRHGFRNSRIDFSRVDIHTQELGVEGVYVSPVKACAQGYAMERLGADGLAVVIHVDALHSCARTHRWKSYKTKLNRQKCFDCKDLLVRAVEFLKARLVLGVPPIAANV
jgi:hypothetical protein